MKCIREAFKMNWNLFWSFNFPHLDFSRNINGWSFSLRLFLIPSNLLHHEYLNNKESLMKDWKLNENIVYAYSLTTISFSISCSSISDVQKASIMTGLLTVWLWIKLSWNESFVNILVQTWMYRGVQPCKHLAMIFCVIICTHETNEQTCCFR